MTRWIIALVALVVLAVGAPAIGAQTQSEAQQRELRARIEERFDVVPLTDGIALRPKSPMRDVRLIEVSDSGIAINGTPVTGRELRDRVGAEGEAILRLSYLDAEARRALFAPQVEAPRPSTAQPPVEAPVETPSPREPRPERPRRATGDRVRVFGDVAVSANESIDGEVVAVIGSARIDGEVSGQVVAVLGSVDLGPSSIVRGDVVSVGGRVRRAPGAQVRGGVTEVSLGDVDVPMHVDWPSWRVGMPFFGGFGSVERLIGSGLRLLLLVLLAAIALMLARPTVEASAQRLADNPVKATVVGLAAQILIGPVLILTAIVLLISFIGIPLLLLLPFVVLVLLLMALVGFSGTALAIGQSVRRTFGIGPAAGFADILLGVVVILLPLLIGRVIAVAGWPVHGLALLLIAGGVAVEYLAWTGGFGAVLTNSFSRWQARRATRTVAPPPPAVP